MIRIKLPNVIQGLTERAFGVFSAEVNRKYRRNENECFDAKRWIRGAGHGRHPAGFRRLMSRLVQIRTARVVEARLPDEARLRR